MFLYHNQASDGFWLLLGHILPSFGLAKNKGLFFGKWLFLTYWSLPLTNLIHTEFSWGVCSSFSQHCAIAKKFSVVYEYNSDLFFRFRALLMEHMECNLDLLLDSPQFILKEYGLWAVQKQIQNRTDRRNCLKKHYHQASW